MHVVRIVSLGLISMGLTVIGASPNYKPAATEANPAHRLFQGKLGTNEIVSGETGTRGATPPRTTLFLEPTSKNPKLRELVGTDQAPRGMPQESMTVRVSVPLYPGARPESKHVRTYPIAVSASWYILAAPIRTYYVNAPLLSVQNWYQNTFAAQGYLLTGSSGMGTTMMTYTFSKDPLSATSKVIGVRLRAQKAGTEVVYGGTLVTVPSRPASSLLPITARILNVVYRKSDRAQPKMFRVTTRPTVRRLVQLLNALPLNRGGDYMDCPVRGTSPSVEVYVTQPPGKYPKALITQNDPCHPGTIGSVQVQSTEVFWTFIQQLMAR